MSINIKGFKELSDYFDKIGKVADKPVNRALNAAGDEVKKIEDRVAKSEHHKYSTGAGRRELRKYPITRAKSGNKIIKIGIKNKNVDFNKIRGLYFNNYGFYHNRTGRYITGSNWLGKAREEALPVAYKTIKDELMKEFRW